ncbi:hypothetical protein AC1031_006706 [Aphanomyces cochlioides]|nr:hypothetical protein AC1031_006706 [Aphanomyces cochlioides]
MSSSGEKITRKDCLARDASDPLRGLRDQFHIPDGLIYLDGNSLGALPRSTPARLNTAMTEEWGRDLIQSWNTAEWIHYPRKVGDKIAQLIGAKPSECLVTDTLSINLFKVLTVAVKLAQPGRKVVLSDINNFPSDLYIAQSVLAAHGLTLQLISADDIPSHLNDSVAAMLFTPVDYRTGRLLDMAKLTAAAHDHNILTIWDLAHSAGAHEIDVHAIDADFVLGCGYKFLNGGPGAPSFVWVHPRLVNRAAQPLAGWFSHANPFSFTGEYVPAEGIQRYACGTPSILAMAALECGVDTVLASAPFGGMQALRAKSIELSQLFIECVDQFCDGFDLELVTPREAALRGSQVSLRHPTHGYAIVQALIARGIIGDFRAPDIIRLGFTPLYTRFVDVYDAAIALTEVLTSGEYKDPKFEIRNTVT